MTNGMRALWALTLVSLALNSYFLVSSHTVHKEAKALAERVGMAEWRLEIICGKGQRAQLCKYDPKSPPPP